MHAARGAAPPPSPALLDAGPPASAGIPAGSGEKAIGRAGDAGVLGGFAITPPSSDQSTQLPCQLHAGGGNTRLTPVVALMSSMSGWVAVVVHPPRASPPPSFIGLPPSRAPVIAGATGPRSASV